MKTILMGRQDESDPSVFVTDAYIARNKAKTRGVLSAVTRPTRCAQLLSHHGLAENLFFGKCHD